MPSAPKKRDYAKKNLPYFGLNVRERRIKKGMSLTALSMRSGISEVHIRNIEEGRDLLGLPAYKRLAVALGYPVPPMLE
jgi:transcriptional regulator with XRE-family HTH domain